MEDPPPRRDRAAAHEADLAAGLDELRDLLNPKSKEKLKIRNGKWGTRAGWFERLTYTRSRAAPQQRGSLLWPQ